jgi:ssDNA-binding Zn-finger/Zn-ribbon topoisomerase 1
MGYATGLRNSDDTAVSESKSREKTSGNDSPGTNTCPACGTQTLRRTAREGFMQRAIYPRFGYYPWKCSGCQAVQLIKNRGARRRRTNSAE